MRAVALMGNRLSSKTRRRRCFLACRWLGGVGLIVWSTTALPADDDLVRNPFHDPMLQVTHGLPHCPVPEEPVYTQKEFRELAHERSQRGVSCWLAGRCRLPNGYLYDAEIVPRVEIAVNERSRFTNTSVWALGQRRRVWLRGCVQSQEQAKELEAVVRNIDDVEDVQLEVMIGVDGVPPYRTTTAEPARP